MVIELGVNWFKAISNSVEYTMEILIGIVLDTKDLCIKIKNKLMGGN